MYEKLCHLLEVAYKDDDIMSQDTLFELQEEIAELLIQAASKIGKEKELVERFPWCFKYKEE